MATTLRNVGRILWKSQLTKVESLTWKRFRCCSATPMLLSSCSKVGDNHRRSFVSITHASKFNNAFQIHQSKRLYSSSDLSIEDVKQRVLDVCKAFDKINADKLTEESHFMNDLGLDSLDQVELIMAMEDEFGSEIPDAEAEKLMRPLDVIKYIATREGLALQGA